MLCLKKIDFEIYLMKFIFQAVKEEDKKKNWIFPVRCESKSFIYADKYGLEKNCDHI